MFVVQFWLIGIKLKNFADITNFMNYYFFTWAKNANFDDEDKHTI